MPREGMGRWDRGGGGMNAAEMHAAEMHAVLRRAL